ncbi:MAG: T9SS C-terminal target domain-containing protein [Chitinophagia bacterium]|nr:T9SS C-terminal target domain-containing protein [Chitinophagia bacterium]
MRLLILSFLCLLASWQAKASHIMGIDLGYRHIAVDTYQVRMVVYADCGAAIRVAQNLATAHPFIKIYKGSTLYDTLSLSINPADSGREITILCTRVPSQCTNLTSAIQGYRKYEYFKTVRLPDTSRYWRFVFEADLGFAYLAGRVSYCTNLAVSGTYVYFDDTLNNTQGANNTPVLNTNMPNGLCLNIPNTYNPDGADADGDSVVYSLASVIDATSHSTVTYTTPLSGAYPIRSASGTFAFNPRNGIINFTPDLLQVAIIKYNVREYRRGVFIGNSVREQALIIKDCTTPAEGEIDSTSAGYTVSERALSVCDTTGAYSFFINPQEVDTSISITVTPSGLPSGAAFTTINNGTNHPHCRFSWTGAVTPGTYGFDLNFVDNRCPTPINVNRHYTINVLTGSACIRAGLPQVKKGITEALQIYPNPAQNLLNISCASLQTEQVVYAIYDLLGKKISEFNASTNANFTYPVALPQGQYILKASLASGSYNKLFTVAP